MHTKNINASATSTYCVVHAFPFNLDKKDQYWDAYSKFKYLTHTFLNLWNSCVLFIE